MTLWCVMFAGACASIFIGQGEPLVRGYCHPKVAAAGFVAGLLGALMGGA